jgi:hypothetical protein
MRNIDTIGQRMLNEDAATLFEGLESEDCTQFVYETYITVLNRRDGVCIFRNLALVVFNS